MSRRSCDSPRSRAPKSVLVTGGTGYLGGGVVDALLGRGHRVTLLVRGQSAGRVPSRWLRCASLELAIGDLAAGDSWREGLPHQEWDAIVHMAALPKLAGASIESLRPLHVEGTARLAELAIARRIPRFLHVSTAFVGAAPGGMLGESQSVRGGAANAYEATKTEAELLLEDTLGQGLEILRPGIILPEPGCDARDIAASPLGFFLEALARAGRHGRCRVPGEPSVRPGFCWRDSVVGFLVGRLESAPPENAMHWNLVEESSMSVASLAVALSALPGLPSFDVVERRGHPALATWEPYLGRHRSWWTEATRGEARGLGIDARPPVAPMVAGLAAAWVRKGRLANASHGEAAA